MKNLPTIAAMRRAFREKDSAFDGIFFVGIKTTGIFCRSVCRAKPAKKENMEFFGSTDEAVRQGYRACKLCRPTESREPPALVGQLMKLVEEDPRRRLGEEELQRRGINPSTARRQFQKYCGMSFVAYQRQRRLGRALDVLGRGRPVVAAQMEAGFESGSGFREACEKLFGTNAANAGKIVRLAAQWMETPLGQMLAVATDEGVALLDFSNRKGMAGAIERLRRRYASGENLAVIVPAKNRHLMELERQLKEYFAGARREFSVPLIPRGSATETQAWRYLQNIPYGQTRSYGQQAQTIGRPAAARAMGRANGMNYLSIVIPCHRVVGASGELTGYGGGLARKRWLLEHEKEHATVVESADSANETGDDVSRHPRRTDWSR